MKAVATESDMMAEDIAVFTNMIVEIAGMEGVPNKIKAETIFRTEQIFHSFIMKKIVGKCKSKAVPSSN
jgi:hypothetical protein